MAYRSVSVFLEDALMAIKEINNFINSIDSVDDYLQKKMLQRAIERNLEIIAEAIKNAVNLEPQLAITNKKKIIGLRNLINHVYYNIDHEIIWKIIKIDLPNIEEEIKTILDDFERKLELNEL